MHPTRRLFSTLAAGALAGAALGPTPGGAASAAPRRRGLDERAIQDAVNLLALAAGDRGGRPVVGLMGPFATAAGRRSLAFNAPAGPQDRARVASITKAMISTLVFQEIEAGTWTLETTIEEVRPGLWPGRGEVTLGQLLNHTSGMPDAIWVLMEGLALWDIPTEMLVRVIGTHYTHEELIALAQQAGWWFEPGTDFGYSNTGYVVLSELLETVTGTPIGDLVRRRIFQPARMTSARLEDSSLVRGAILEDYAAYADGRYARLRTIDQSVFSGAGGVYATATDITNFYGALMTGRLISQDSVDTMITPTGPAAQWGYAYGIFLWPDPCPDHAGEFLYGHDGGGFGSLSIALSSRDGSRRMAGTLVGRPYWIEGAMEVWGRIENLVNVSMTVNCATSPAPRERRVTGRSARALGRHG